MRGQFGKPFASARGPNVLNPDSIHDQEHLHSDRVDISRDISRASMSCWNLLPYWAVPDANLDTVRVPFTMSADDAACVRHFRTLLTNNITHRIKIAGPESPLCCGVGIGASSVSDEAEATVAGALEVDTIHE